MSNSSYRSVGMTPLRAFYAYLEERRLGERSARRRRNVDATWDSLLQGRVRNDVLPFSGGKIHTPIPSGAYTWRRTRILEGRDDLPETEGVWPINHWRSLRINGDPGLAVCPELSRPEEWPANVDGLASQFRLHHYFRVRNVAEAIQLAAAGQEIRLSVRATTDWYDPPNGVLPPFRAEVYQGDGHAVPCSEFDAYTQRFVFPNSWGSEWGDGGIGYLSADDYDDYVVEAWRPVGQGLSVPLQSRDGLVAILWKCGYAYSGDVHGREIVDASSGARIGWAFARSDGPFIDLEEFFVWPTFRRRGYGRALAELVLELVRATGKPLRAWIPFPDSELENQANLTAALRILDLQLHDSPYTWAGYLALREAPTARPKLPTLARRAASMRQRLLYGSPEALTAAVTTDEETQEATGARVYRVWYGTNRAPIQHDRPELGFSAERSKSITFGFCDVVIPRSHRFGSVGTPWWKRLLRSDDDHLFLQAMATAKEEEFWISVRDVIAKSSVGSRDSLIYLHGYNVTFEDAAIRAAQIGFDLKIPGITGFFAWPSQGNFRGYPADETTIEWSEQHIADFVVSFAQTANCGRLHIVAHSMGNRGLIRAFQRIADGVQSLTDTKIGQIILAAPDIDAGTFENLAPAYISTSERTTLYASPLDRAVRASRILHRFPRVGLTPPITVVKGIDTIVVPRFNVFDLLGHGYYAEAAPLLHDMFDLIRRNAPPNDRLRLEREFLSAESCFWTVCE